MKIKQVKIQAFKSYLHSKDGTFDFTRPGEPTKPANFISIYAPNGFGKTSFYDAVDYCMTNNISRYIRSKVKGMNQKEAKTHNQKGEKQYILRNRNADNFDESLETEIEIQTTKGLETSKYIKPRKGSMDYKFDPKDSLLGSEYVQQIMLTQEAIDAFLKEDNPIDRYNTFIKNNGHEELKVANDNRTTINSMLNDIEKLENEYTNNKNNTQDEIDKIKIPNNIYDDVNDTIQTLNDSGSDFATVNSDYTAADRLQFENNINKSKAQINQNLARQRTNISAIETFISSSDKLQRDHSSKQQLDIELKHLFATINNKQEQSKRLVEMAAYKKNHTDISQRISALNGYIEQIPAFVVYQTSEKDVLRRLDDSAKKLKALKASVQMTDENLLIYRGELQTQNDLKQSLASFSEEIPDYYLEMTKLRNQTLNYKEQVEQKASDERKSNNNISLLNTELAQISSFDIEQSIGTDIKLSITEQLNTIHQQYVAHRERQQQLESNIDVAGKNLKNTQTQSTAIAALIKQSTEIITTSQQSNCPLCNQSYDSIIDLQKAIASNPALSDVEKNYIEQLNKLTNTHQATTTKIDDFKASYKEICQTASNSMKLTVQKWNQELKQNAILQSNLNSKIENCLLQLDGLIKKTLSKTSDELNQHTTKQIQACSLKIEEFSAKIELTEKQKAINVDEQTLNQRDFNQLSVKRDTILSDSTFDDFRSFLSTNAIDEHIDTMHEQLVILRQVQQQESNKLNELITATDEQIKDIESKIPIEYQDHDITRLQLLTNERELSVATLSSEIAKHQPALDLLKVELTQISDHIDNLVNTAKEAVNNLKLTVELSDKQLSNLDLLSTLVTSTANFSRKVELQNEIDNADRELQALDDIKTPLKNDLMQISNQLEQSIEQYFHTELINQLYQTIDPHPEFKDVEFSCKIPETGERAELHIKLKNTDDGSMISPSIDFSSAQINVLSLSIFLARALNAKNKDEPVDCIFIDDPIQSMDSINVLGLIDLFRNLSYQFDKQLIISTHDENFHELLKKKIPTDVFGAKYLKLESFGKVVVDQS